MSRRDDLRTTPDCSTPPCAASGKLPARSTSRPHSHFGARPGRSPTPPGPSSGSARATQALPNGYCGLPVQQTCPHANACLTCPMFLTTGEFLPQHHAQRQQTLELITAAEARGQQRLAEMNRTVLSNLDTIIDTLETPETAEHAL